MEMSVKDIKYNFFLGNLTDGTIYGGMISFTEAYEDIIRIFKSRKCECKHEIRDFYSTSTGF